MTAPPAPRAAPLAVVTGATSGIGLELARLLAADGYRLLLVARGADQLAVVAGDLAEAHGVQAHPFALDLSEDGAAARLAAHLGADVPDVLVNNAGFGTFGPFAATDAAQTHALVATNVVALTDLTRALLPGMVARGRGRILNVASTAAFQPGPLMAAYYASKAYVLSLSEALADELRGSGVTVTALCPGPTETGFQARAAMGASKLVQGRKLPSAREVAEAGYAAMRAGRVVAIPGLVNRIGAFLPRLVPRRWTTALVRRMQEGR